MYKKKDIVPTEKSVQGRWLTLNYIIFFSKNIIPPKSSYQFFYFLIPKQKVIEND